MTRSESGKLGAIKSLETHRKKQQERINTYTLNPATCTCCNKALPYKKRNYKFCSKSCSATISNKNRTRTCWEKTSCGVIKHIVREDKFCIHCGEKLMGSRSKLYCDLNCFQKERARQYADEVEKTGKFPVTGKTGCTSLNKKPKAYLIKKYGHQCFICHTELWNGVPVPLVLDHIDGDSNNWCIENIRVVCGNCDMQLPTYKGRNIGNGREYRRQRYKEGKSY